MTELDPVLKGLLAIYLRMGVFTIRLLYHQIFFFIYPYMVFLARSSSSMNPFGYGMLPVEDERKLSEFPSRSRPENTPVAVKEIYVPDPSANVPVRDPVPFTGKSHMVDQR